MTKFTVLSVTKKSIAVESADGEQRIFNLSEYPNLADAKKGDVLNIEGDATVTLESKPAKAARTPSSGSGSTHAKTNKQLM